MSSRPRSIVREIGAAVAVLSLYLLVLLVPLHQAAASQRDLARLGFETTTTWSICDGLAKGQNPDRSSPTKCPVTGIATAGFVDAPATLLQVGYPGVALAVAHRPPAAALLAASYAHFGQSRAPPNQS